MLRTHDDRLIPVAGVYHVEAPTPMGDERVGFSAATEINREDFGLTCNVALETGGLLVGKAVRIELAVQAVAATNGAVA